MIGLGSDKKSVLWQFRWFASVGSFASCQGTASKFHGIKIVTTGRSSPWRWLYKARGQKCSIICFIVCLYNVHPIFSIGSVKSVSRWQVCGWPLMTSLLKMERWTCSRSPLCQRCPFLWRDQNCSSKSQSKCLATFSSTQWYLIN